MTDPAEEPRPDLTTVPPAPAELRRLNWGALLITPVWAIANCQWPGILFLPAWAFVDNIARGPQRFGAWQVALSWGMVAVTVALQTGYALMADRLAWIRSRGTLDVEAYLRVQRRWAIVGALTFAAMIAAIALALSQG